jgi:hypothetical protein
MKVDKVMYYALLFFASILKFITAFGVPFCIVSLGYLAGLWQFSWGGVLVVYIFYAQLKETKMSMDLLGLTTDDEEDE